MREAHSRHITKFPGRTDRSTGTNCSVVGSARVAAPDPVVGHGHAQLLLFTPGLLLAVRAMRITAISEVHGRRKHRVSVRDRKVFTSVLRSWLQHVLRDGDIARWRAPMPEAELKARSTPVSR